MYTILFRKFILFIFVLLFAKCLEINSQNAVLKHSYTFDDGTSKDVVGDAHGIIHGDGKIIDGAFVTTSEGGYIELPADKIKINSYQSISIEAFFIASKNNTTNTMMVYFGNIAGTLGNDYLFMSPRNQGECKVSISCKNSSSPWDSQTSVGCGELYDEKPHHLVTTFDSKELKFFVDGVLIGTTTNERYPYNIINNIGEDFAFICKGGYSEDPTWKGIFDQLNVYEGILDPTTIAQSATKYIPGLDMEKLANYLINPFRNIVIDDSGSFKTPVTGEQIFFAELMPMENDRNNSVDEYLVLSDTIINDLSKDPITVRLSSLSGYLNVLNGDKYSYDENTKIIIEVGDVYQCWIQSNLKTNTYNVYVKTSDHEKPVLIYKDAVFGKNVSELKYWRVMHDNEVSNDAMAIKAFSKVKNIGDYPSDYIATIVTKKSILDEKIPADALVIENPEYGFHNDGQVDIKKIVITDKQTSVYIRAHHSNTSYIFITKNVYIQPVNSPNKLFITGTEGVPMNIYYYASAKGYTDAKLIFPPIDPHTKAIDYGETSRNWYIYDVQINPVPRKFDIPDELMGAWFNKNNGNTDIVFLDTVALYKNMLWTYKNIEVKKKEIKLTLINNEKTLPIKVQNLKKGVCSIGETKDDLISYCNSYSDIDKNVIPEEKAYELPVFKVDSAIYAGYIKGYSTRYNNRTISIHVNDIITGNQNTFVAKIEDNGYFSIKLPIYYPHVVFVRSNYFNGSVFLEPGKDLFQVIGKVKNSERTVFMGTSARINDDLQKVNNFYSYDYNYANNHILDMSANDFKNYCLNAQDKDLKQLDSLYTIKEISEKAYQVKKLDITYRYPMHIMEYSQMFESAYRSKNNIPNTQRATDMKMDTLTAEYYDCIDNMMLNNPLAVLSTDYGSYINRVEYLDIIRGRLSLSTQDIIMELQKSEYSPSDFEKEMFEKYNELEKDKDLRYKPTDEENEKLRVFSSKYQKELTELSKKEKNLDATLIVNYFKESGIELTEDEIKLMEVVKKAEKSEYSIKQKEFSAVYGDSLNNLFDKHKTFINEIFSKMSLELRDKNLSLLFNVQSGLATDIMFAQDKTRSIVDEFTPISDNELKIIQKQIKTPFIAEYIAMCNENTKAQIELNKLKTGYVVNDIPKAEGEKLFDAMMAKYKGKVVYVDFWATWCGPCRSSMQNQMTMKESFKENKDMVFVYITNPSSPENTYNNMIPNIHGEHYRVSNDEWNFLTAKFNISGIPHYVIVNKDGEVVDANAPREPSVLTERFNKLLRE